MNAQLAQDIFRKVIEAGFYFGPKHTDFYMCHALDSAQFADVITSDEYNLAKDEIINCLERSGISCTALGSAINGRRRELFNPDGNYTEIYWNWAEQRPF